jgi:hypothetical protein
MKKNLTPAQIKLKAELDKGREIGTFNAHRMNSGEYRFIDTGELVSYKVYWNLVSYAPITPEEKEKYRNLNTKRFFTSYNTYLLIKNQ